ncbi:MAG: alcohol dehydrogenase catalytic domain-containing protein [Thermogemmatispora sp.]|uniref:zinc-dependent dehydrogenase n=1 Tax=Thermogemmatispora sp. TaxID=1968838 RepID=UPI00262CE464|nr:zinc-dependent dehydrogenase [Thermogemmatispora sp.]MBX5455845.1 alcohol dehydrogenase catalytic domain-containing protein [Thermogemmatispora sp.]
MRAVEYHSNQDVRVVELPQPTIGPGELLVRLVACGICASDVMEWYMRPRAPLYPGHEPVGVVEAVGEGVAQFKVGDRVFVHHHVPCMVCHYCQRGAFSQCPTFRATRLDPGGLAEYIRVPAPNVERDVLLLPASLSFEAATLIEPLACCIRGIERAMLRAGDRVLILGAGSNGIMLAQLARLRGAVRVMVVDPIAYRRERALEVGADLAFDPEGEPLLPRVLAANDGRKPDVVIVTPSKVQAMRQGLELVGPGGTVLLFAPPPPEEQLPVTPNELFFREITLRTSYSAGPYETRQALDLLATGRIRAESVITHRFPLPEAAQAFRLVAQPGEALKVVILAAAPDADLTRTAAWSENQAGREGAGLA